MAISSSNYRASPIHYRLPDEVVGYALDPRGSWWSSIVPEESRNLIINPSFEANAIEYNTSGDWAFGGALRVEFPDVGATAGRACYKLVTFAANSWLAYDEGVVVTAGAYTFSLDAYVPAIGLSVFVEIRDGGTLIARQTHRIRSTGWQRHSLTYVETGSGTRKLRFGIVGSYPSDTILYTDAWQFERKAYATTYIDGDMVGFYDLQPNQSFYWEGASHASPSVRRKSTAAGGRVVAWDEQIGFLTTSIVGLGMGTVEAITQLLSDGTEIHRGANLFVPRDFSIVGRIYADDHPSLQRKMRELTRLLRPNNTKGGSQQIIRYQETNGRGVPIGVALDIVCLYRDGMGGGITNHYQQSLAVQFHASQPHLIETVDSAAELTVSKLLYNNCIIFKDEDGDYVNLSTDTFDAFVRCVDFDVRGRPLAVGPFNDIGGDTIEDVAYWDGTAWQQLGSDTPGGNLSVDGGWRFGFGTAVGVTGNISQYSLSTDDWSDLDAVGVNGPVNVVVRDVSGDIYAGGAFDDDGAEMGAGLDFANVLKYDYVDEEFQPLGGGVTHATLTASVDAILIHDQFVYVGGLFDEAHATGMIGPAVAANCVARWDIVNQSWGNMSSGFDGRVNELLLGEDGFIYAVGDFERDGGDDIDLRGIARWNGVSWEEPFILAHVDATYGAAGAALDERGIMWFFDAINDADDHFDVSQTIGPSETFGWKDGVFYPTFVVNSEGLQDLAIGPGNRVLFSVLNLADPAVPAILVPALNEIEYEGDANTPLVVHLNGPMHPYHVLCLDNDGGVYFLPTLNVGENEEMVIRADTHSSIMYSDGRPNLYRYMSAGSSSTKVLYLRPGTNRVSIFADEEEGSESWLTWRNRYHGVEGAE